MAELIDITDIQAFKPISANIDVAKKVVPYIIEAQEFDLRPILGEELYVDVITNPDDYTDLLDPKTYTYQGKTYQHNGLKAVLVYYAYARYKSNSNANDTAFGTVVKTTQHSTPVDYKVIKNQVEQAKAGAVAYQNRIIDFLNRNHEEYPLWNYAYTNKANTGFRIRAIGGNSKVGSSYRCKDCGKYSCNCNYRY